MTDKHTQIILDRYAGDQSGGVPNIDVDILTHIYLAKVMALSELQGKTLLEIGAGCSQYAPLFLNSDIKKYVANDLIEARLALSRTADERHIQVAGDFLEIELKEQFDFVFASLTMMFVVPLFDDFIEKIYNTLKPGGVFISFDPNYLCPVSIYRRFSDKTNNPARLFNPLKYAERFKSSGFIVEVLTPFAGSYPKLGGSWLTGTSFCMRARKQ